MTPLSPAFSTLDYGYKQELDFDILIQNIPRCARLCFTICASSKYGKGDNVSGILFCKLKGFFVDLNRLSVRQKLENSFMIKLCRETQLSRQ